MRPKLEIIPLDFSSSITVKRLTGAHIDYPHWHYHPEHEIVYVGKSSGIKLIGNHVGSFQEGDLIFISSNLPHLWKNNKNYYNGSGDQPVDVYVVHFRQDSMGKKLFDIPEMSHIKHLFSLGQQGFQVKGTDAKRIANRIKKLYYSSRFDRIIMLFKVLDAIAKTPEYTLLSDTKSGDFMNSNSKKTNKIINFMVSNYTRSIRLEDVSDFANLNKTSFCRYFKSFTQKTFTQYLNELRIAKACDLLLNTDKPVTSICYETGYNNISHFNRQFKAITGITAREYRKK